MFCVSPRFISLFINLGSVLPPALESTFGSCFPIGIHKHFAVTGGSFGGSRLTYDSGKVNKHRRTNVTKVSEHLLKINVLFMMIIEVFLSNHLVTCIIHLN